MPWEKEYASLKPPVKAASFSTEGRTDRAPSFA